MKEEGGNRLCYASLVYNCNIKKKKHTFSSKFLNELSLVRQSQTHSDKKTQQLVVMCVFKRLPLLKCQMIVRKLRMQQHTDKKEKHQTLINNIKTDVWSNERKSFCLLRILYNPVP